MKNRYEQKIVKDLLSNIEIQTYTHASGLKIHHAPRVGFNKKFACFILPFGSNDLTIQDKNDAFHVYPGAAHYLEHCVYSRGEDGGLMGQFALSGTYANAFTDNISTVYYLSTLDSISESVLLYLQAILNLKIDKERIDAERPIICAELDMYLDDVDSKAYFRLMRALFQKHPQQFDVGGTKESIQEIDEDLLKKIADAFYVPNKVSLVLVGDINIESLLLDIDQVIEEKIVNPDVRTLYASEPESVREPEVNLFEDVQTESFYIGIKDKTVDVEHPLSGQALVARQVQGKLLGQVLFGESSVLYQELYDLQLINDAFDYQYVCQNTVAFWVISGESPDIKKAVNHIKQALQKNMEAYISQEALDLAWKVEIGSYMTKQENIENLGFTLAKMVLAEVTPLEYGQAYLKSPVIDLEALAYLKEDHLYSVVYVKQGGQNG